MHSFILSRRNYHHLIILSLVIFSISSLACGSKAAPEGNKDGEKKSDQTAKSDAQISVTTAKVVSKDVPAFIQTSGSLIADETSDVAPKVAGKVVNVYVNVGDFVKQGSTIARIDDKDARLRLIEAETNVKQATAGVRQAEAKLGLSPNGTFNSSTIPEVRAAGANVVQAQAELRQSEVAVRQAEVNLRQAEVNEKRYRELVETGDVAMITYEQFRTARDAAAAARDSAKTARESSGARVNSAKQQLDAVINTAKQNDQAIKSAQANVDSSKTQVVSAQQAIADTIIRAPFSGFVSERQTAVGEFVTSSTSIIKLMRTNPIKIELKVAEADIPQIGIGRSISIEVAAFKERKFSGIVTAVNPALDTASRSATVEAQIDNSGNLLRSGMFANARINREGGNAGLFVPKSAVFFDQATQASRIFVIEENIAKLKVVQLGTEENDTVQVLSGLAADQVVATSNLEQLYEGAKVGF